MRTRESALHSASLSHGGATILSASERGLPSIRARMGVLGDVRWGEGDYSKIHSPLCYNAEWNGQSTFSIFYLTIAEVQRERK